MFIKTGNLFLYHLFEHELPTLCKFQTPRTSYHFNRNNCVNTNNMEIEELLQNGGLR